jgi:predicted nucleic acid-binding protein
MPHILVLDANIIIRAVLGQKVRNLLNAHSDFVKFFTPDICVADVSKYLPKLFEKRGLPYKPALEVFSKLQYLLSIVDLTIYREREEEAKERIKNRDPDDWPIVAVALMLNCPIWTEDKDFFGLGLPVWTTDRIHLFLIQYKNRSNGYSLPSSKKLLSIEQQLTRSYVLALLRFRKHILY